MSTITAILEPHADGTLHLPLPIHQKNSGEGWRIKVVAKIEWLPMDHAKTEEHRSPNPKVLALMERIAGKNPFKTMSDPVEWQREMRDDVKLPCTHRDSSR